jgi:multiple sugar transport system ATP-binding protein
LAVIEIRNLVKEFDHGRVRAIDGVDLATKEVSTLVLLGPSQWVGCLSTQSMGP